ncbi:MAG TPA: hypothetical protein VFP68_18985, partial [Burkholderiaceae bacterium]|nr:hypothetical protein [Burkholderiaceae bacterium]
GSVQGEVLQADMLLQIAEDMGYRGQSYKPSDLDDFRSIVTKSIADGNPVATVFPVDRETGRPSSHFDGRNEHAALIVGYNLERDTVDLAHWKRLYKKVPMKQLYDSMQTLPETREPEVYQRKGTSVSSSRTAKYSMVKSDAVDSDEELLFSKIPEPGSGFNNTLFLMTPDPEHERWQ